MNLNIQLIGQVHAIGMQVKIDMLSSDGNQVKKKHSTYMVMAIQWHTIALRKMELLHRRLIYE